jgi:excisionase family DNA binding protein
MSWRLSSIKESPRNDAVDDSVPGEALLTKCEVALLCRVEVRTVERWVAAGKISCYRTPGGRLLFRKRDLLRVADRL